MRYAIYFTPPQDDPLTKAAQTWLARDAFTGKQLQARAQGGLSDDIVAFHTASARRYGFHGTIVAPFHLKDGCNEAELVKGFQDFCAQQQPIAISKMCISRLDSFFALVPDAQSQTPDQLAGEAVRYFSQWRAPLSEEDMQRRTSQTLSMRQLSLLQRWGYPFVMEEFRFHMTLTGKVPAVEQAAVEDALNEVFSTHLNHPLVIQALALFVEPEPGAPFCVHTYTPFSKQHIRRTA